MRGILAIFRRDFGALMGSPFIYGIAGLCATLYSLQFLQGLVRFELTGGGDFHQAVVVQHISIANLIFILVVPILTMRLLAEEKRNRTFDLLLTTPISSTQIAVGKFLAGYAVAGLLVLLSMLYPLACMLFVDFSAGLFWTSYAGLFLVVAVYVAVGLFTSSVTESVIFSAVIGVIVNLSLWLLSQWAMQMEGSTTVAVMEQLALVQQFVKFIEGKLEVSALVYFLSVVTLFVFLSERVVESARWR
jgi:ABC-2 type transport system permease protein